MSVVVLSLVAALPATVTAAPPSASAGSTYQAGAVLVRFAPPTDERTRGAQRQRVGARKVHDFGRLVPGLELWSLPKSVSVAAALAAIRTAPDVLYAEPDYIVQALATPNDPLFGNLWGMHNTGQSGGVADADIDAPEAWDVTTGSSDVVVGVVDTGIDDRHPELGVNMWTNPGEIAGNGIDDDGNGFVDDVYGWNALADNGNAFDDHGHGTHCSGTIGAAGNNSLGVVGVAWRVKLMALKFLNASGFGAISDAIQAVDYAVAQKRRGVNVRVLSNSWGGGSFSQAMLDSINAANGAGILFVAAAGNGATSTDITPNYPSNYDAPNVISVAATTRTDALAGFSNYGATTVDLAAPGQDVLSTWPNNTYSLLSGTSMATPHVSGVAALIASIDPNIGVDALKSRILQGVDQLSSLQGRTVTGGRLNAYKAVTSIAPPAPGFSLAVTPTSAAVTQGQSATYSVSVTPTNGFTGSVTLSLSSSPALQGTTATFNPNPVSAGGTSTLTLATTTTTSAGTYQLTITGTSGSLVRTTSATLTVNSASPPADTTPPTVSITSPSNGATVSGAVTVAATASDNTGVVEVRFFADGAPIGSDTTSPYAVTWDTSSASAGNHLLTAQAVDPAGNVGTSPGVTVTVATTADVVVITEATWRSRQGELRLVGTVSSRDSSLTATFGGRTEVLRNSSGKFNARISGVASNPGTVTVTSSGGGSATSPVTTE